MKDALGQLDDEGRVLLAAAQQWREANPMLGTRGVRLGILKPGLYRMQVKAILEAALAAQARGRRSARRDHDPAHRHRSRARARRRLGARGRGGDVRARRATASVDYLVGTMIETPRAALAAGEIAEVAEFFSFGTNDLTQMTFGFSPRRRRGPLHDRVPRAASCCRRTRSRRSTSEGVGELVRMGRRARPRRRAPTSSSASAASTAATRRRCAFCRRGRPRLRVVLALPRADRPPGRGPRRRSAPPGRASTHRA